MPGRNRVSGDDASGTGRVLGLYRKLILQRFGQDVARVVLFGSRARLEDHRDSDWDVAVFLKRPITAAEQRSVSEVGHDVMCQTGAIVQSMALPAGRWEASDELIRNIRRDAVMIYE